MEPNFPTTRWFHHIEKLSEIRRVPELSSLSPKHRSLTKLHHRAVVAYIVITKVTVSVQGNHPEQHSEIHSVIQREELLEGLPKALGFSFLFSSIPSLFRCPCSTHDHQFRTHRHSTSLA
ncbi:hypothetical protein V6N13_036798 [Hibiscus sabdariffa]